MSYEKIINLIVQGGFDEASKLIDKNDNKLFEELCGAAYDMKNITFYCFSQFMYLKTDNLDWLDLSVSILTSGLCCIEGGYQMALFHQRQLLEKRRSLDDLQMMLFFYEVPDVDFDKDEALSIAREILKIDPRNKIVRHVFPGLRKQK